MNRRNWAAFGIAAALLCPLAPAAADGPASDVVRSLSADFSLGFALRHTTLHRLPGNSPSSSWLSR